MKQVSFPATSEIERMVDDESGELTENVNQKKTWDEVRLVE